MITLVVKKGNGVYIFERAGNFYSLHRDSRVPFLCRPSDYLRAVCEDGATVFACRIEAPWFPSWDEALDYVKAELP